MITGFYTALLCKITRNLRAAVKKYLISPIEQIQFVHTAEKT